MIDRLILIGTVRAAPELFTTDSASPCCRLQLVVRNHCKDRGSGLWGEHSRCFTVAVVGSAARRCFFDLADGDLVTVSGRLRWPQQGESDSQTGKASLLVTEHVPARAGGVRCAATRHATGASTSPGPSE
ncbi:MAG: single-stranded DNA-binding protein [Thermoleophilia bacterium]